MAEQQAKVSSQGVDATNSSNQEVGENEQNPAISNPRWEDTKGQAITKALVGDEVYLCADITDIADGTTVTIKIVEKDADGKDDPVTTLSAVVSGDRIKCQWQVTYTADEDDADGQKELKEKGTEVTYDEVLKDMRQRDYNDSHRAVAPLKPAEDSVIADTTGKNIEESLDMLLNIIKEKNI